jgi:hypothetical protein
MAGLWRNSAGTREGKYLVKRRDGTIPAWPHFVLGARDPMSPYALLAYADIAEKFGKDPEFVADIRALARERENLRSICKRTAKAILMHRHTGKTIPKQSQKCNTAKVRDYIS